MLCDLTNDQVGTVGIVNEEMELAVPAADAKPVPLECEINPRECMAIIHVVRYGHLRQLQDMVA
jgi:hypothetical protein